MNFAHRQAKINEEQSKTIEEQATTIEEHTMTNEKQSALIKVGVVRCTHKIPSL